MSADSGGSFATLTHARLRAAQGDVEGAKRILRVILDVKPAHRDARELLAQVEGRAGVVREEPREDVPEPASAATAEDLASRFRGVLNEAEAPSRVETLTRWLTRVRNNRDSRHVR